MGKVGEEPPQGPCRRRPAGEAPAALGLPPIAGGSKDAPSTPDTVPHRSSPRAALPAPAPPGCHPPTCPAALHDTKPPVQGLPTCHFHPPSSSCLPSAAVPAFLPAPFSAHSLPTPTPLLVFNSLTSSLPQPTHSLPCMPLHLLPLTLPSPALGRPQPSLSPARAGAP